MRLLVPLALAGRLRYCLIEAFAIHLNLGLTIGGAASIGGEVTIGFLRYSL